MQIAVVDLGIGNLRSVVQAMKHVAPDQDVFITGDANAIMQAERMVLPGQGAIGSWFASYRDQKLEQAVMHALANKPVFGICVGMQAMFEYCTEDGGMPGLGVFAGRVEHFSQHQTSSAKVPHMGWSAVKQCRSHPLFQGVEDGARFYFANSYCANSPDADIVLGETDYFHKFVSVVGRDNVFATQFHPEKSHTDGLRLLKNFAHWDGQA